MPLCAARKGDKWRVIECNTGEVAKNNAGTAIDGGGYGSKEQAVRQMQAVNIAMARERGVHIPKPRK